MRRRLIAAGDALVVAVCLLAILLMGSFASAQAVGKGVGAPWKHNSMWSARFDATYTSGAITDARGATATFANTGPVDVWNATTGRIVQFADNAPILGVASIWPGYTGAGYQCSGLYIASAHTNSVPRSRELNTGWSAAGTSVVATSAVQLFADARQVYKVVDDNASGAEYIYQAVSKGGGTSRRFWFLAATESGTGKLTVRSQESTGASCSGPAAVSVATFDVTTTPTVYTATVNFTDTNCTAAYVYLYPYDFTVGNAATGSVAFVLQTINDGAYNPGHYCETAATAVTCGADILKYNVASSGIVDGSGNSVRPTRWMIDFTPMASGYASAVMLARMDNGTVNQRINWNINTTLTFNFITAPDGTTKYTTAVQTFVPGTQWSWISYVDFVGDRYATFLNGAYAAGSTAANDSPTGMTTIMFGSNGVSGSLPVGGICFARARIQTK